MPKEFKLNFKEAADELYNLVHLFAQALITNNRAVDHLKDSKSASVEAKQRMRERAKKLSDNGGLLLDQVETRAKAILEPKLSDVARQENFVFAYAILARLSPIIINASSGDPSAPALSDSSVSYIIRNFPEMTSEMDKIFKKYKKLFLENGITGPQASNPSLLKKDSTVCTRFRAIGDRSL